MTRAAFAALIVAVVAASAWAGEAKGRFTGSEACGQCHEAQLAQWRITAHARAADSLRQRARLRRCQSCHTTGDAPAGRPAFSGVGCESCHGAGAGYSPDDIMRDPTLAAALGLRDLSTPEARKAVCARCHGSGTRISTFDPEQAWERIKH